MIVISACQWSGDAMYTASRSFSSSNRRKSLKSRGLPPTIVADMSSRLESTSQRAVDRAGLMYRSPAPPRFSQGTTFWSRWASGRRNRRPRPPRPMCPILRRSLGAGVASTDAGTMVIPSDVEAAPERKVLRVTRSLLFMLVSAIAVHSPESPAEECQLPTESDPATAVNLSATQQLERLGRREPGSSPAGQGGHRKRASVPGRARMSQAVREERVNGLEAHPVVEAGGR